MTRKAELVKLYQSSVCSKQYVELLESKYKRRILQRAYSDYRRCAQRRKLKFNFTYNEFGELYGGECYYCGEEIDGIRLDRIDNEKGYTKDNIVRCCKKCNFMKSKLNQSEFVNQCIRVAQNFAQQKKFLKANLF